MGLFENKVMLVVGGARGMGRATAIACAREGATVVVSDLRAEQGAETIALIEQAGQKAQFIATDIGDAASVERLFQTIKSDHGRLDGAFNAAAIAPPPSEITETPLEVWDNAFRINTRGNFLCLQQELRMMKTQGHGAVVVVSSGAGLKATPLASAYVASKHAVVGMVKAAALDMAPYGIRVNCLCPGTTRTEMIQQWFDSVPGSESEMTSAIPMRRLGMPQDMANTAVWLLSDAAGYITGQSISVDGGLLIAIAGGH